MPPHPLPARPPAASPRNPGAQSPGLGLPRSPFFSAPQPSSPRPTGFSPYPSGSPKIAGPGPRGSGENPPVEDPLVWVRKAIAKEDLTPNPEFIDLGEGWRVQWRTWKGPALLPPRGESSSSVGTTSAVGTPQGATLTTTSSKSSDDTHKKRARPPTAFEEMLAEEEALAAAAKTPSASTSTAPPLKDRLHALRQLSPQSDPIEAARREACRQAARLPETARPFGLFSCVRVNPVAEEDVKGKGKAKQGEYQFARTLWVFCVTKGGGIAPVVRDPARDPKSALLELSFPDLTDCGTGEFTHRDLFPALYPAPPSQSTSMLSPVPERPETTYTSPSQLPASSFPSVLSLTSHLISDTPSATTNQPRFKGPYEAFIAAASEALVISLIGDPPLAESAAPYTTNTRLDDAVVFLPQTTEPFGSSGRRIVPEAVKATFRLSCHRGGLYAQPTVTDVALRPFPSSASSLLVDSPLVLAPFGTSARFIKVHALPSSPFGSTAESLPGLWQTLLEGSGLAIPSNERWILCRVEFLNSKNGPVQEEELEVVWPASLCFLDGSKAQPQRSPQYTSLRSKALEPAPSASSASSPAASAPSPAVPVPPLESVARRKLATSLSRHPILPSAYRDPVSQRAEQVGSMLEEMTEERSKRLRAQKEAEAQPVAAPPTPTQTPSASDAKVLPTSFSSSSTTGAAGAPINMRTPISLGGSSTEAPSPADGFISMDRALSNFMSTLPQDAAQNTVGLDALYPSPPEVHGPSGTNTIEHQLARQDGGFASAPMTMDTSFNDFDWGTDFGTGLPASLPPDFEDGMMMGLTDDDFSFYDEPAPIVSHPTAFAGLSYDTPKLLDHFPHLTGTTPFPSAASPTSPFSHPSDHHNNASPGVLNFGFDAHTPHHLASNALGLGTLGAPLNEGSPFKTPRTPYSAYVDVNDDPMDTPSVGHQPLSIASTPALWSSNSSSSSFYRPGMFEPVPFGQSHVLSDVKYDPRKGKFGLPSPAAEADDLSTTRRPMAAAPWYTTICDPRVTAAGELKRRRKPSLARLSGKSDGRRLTYSHHVRPRSWIRAELDDAAIAMDDESDGEAMDVEEETQLRHSDDLLPGALTSSITLPFGATVLLLRQHFVALAHEDLPKPTLPATITKAMTTADVTTESGVLNLGVQMLYNLDFRAWVKDSLPTSLSQATITVSSQAIQLVSTRFSNLARSDANVALKAAPMLTQHTSPAILLRAQQSVLQISPSAMSYWRPMDFEPLAGAKDVTAFAVYEEGSADLNGAVKAWLGRVSEAYKDSRLGNHAAGTVIEDGLARLPAGTLSLSSGREDLRSLCSQLADTARSVKHVVVYLLTPPGSLPTSATSPIAATIHQLTKLHFGSNMSLLVYALPISAIGDARSVSIGSSSINRLSSLAFSVYNQLVIPVQRLSFPVAETFNSIPIAPYTGPVKQLFQFPAVTISPARQLKVDFELHWPPSSLEVMHRHRFLHVGYTALPAGGEPGLEWVVTACIDEKGEMWETTPKLVRISAGQSADLARAKAVWRVVARIAETVDVEWRIVICRVGSVLRPEIKAWDNLLKEVVGGTKRPRHVTFVGSDLQPPLAVRSVHGLSGVLTPATSGPLDSEEGEVTGHTQSRRAPKAGVLDSQPAILAYTPSEPITIGAARDIIAPASTYIVHLPRTSTLAHSDVDVLAASGTSSAISVLGVHVLLAYASKSSLLAVTLGEHLGDIRQSYVELSALGQLRWGTSGRLPWHIDAVRQLGVLLRALQD